MGNEEEINNQINNKIEGEETNNETPGWEAHNYEERIEILQDILELEEEEAEKALELAEGDVDEAIDMGEFVDECYLVIQGKLNYGGYNKTYGLFYLIADGKNGEPLKNESKLSNEYDLWEVDLEVNNKVLAKTLADHPALERESLRLNKILSPAEIFDLYKYTKNEETEEVKILLQNKLEEELEVAIEVVIKVELKTKPQLENMHSNLFTEETKTEKKEAEKREQQNDELGLDVVLKCLPMVSPTQGKRPVNLNLGERLLVKIVEDSELGNYFRNLLGNEAGLTTGIIKEINLQSTLDSYEIKLQFGPDIYGKVVVGTEIKVVSNPDDDILTENQESESGQKQKLFHPLVLILLGIIIGLIIILVSLYV